MYLGDCIAVILGCPLPIALRPTPEGAYRVLGPSHVHGVVDGEGFLGPLPENYSVKVVYDPDGLLRPRFKNEETGVQSIDDPRLANWPVPEDWEPIEWTRTREDPMICVKYKNKSTGEIINSDPRLTPEILKSRGVLVKTISLV